MSLPDVEAFERAGLLAWPGIDIDWDGHWVRRAANGYTKRANSLQCFAADDGAGCAARLDAAVAWFIARGVPPVVRTTPLESAGLTAELDRRNWQSIDLSHLYAMPLAARPEADPEAEVTPLLDGQFLAAQQALQGHDQRTMDRMAALLAAMAVPAAGVVVYRQGVPVAAGLAAIADGIVLTGNVITSAAHRRQGLGAAMMRTIHAWAHGAGARIAALNVQADNPAGKALYQSLGYTHQYDYSYRIPKEA
ncbi:MAG: GNAT family N-acetyltransferase [Devosia sp.]|uniref:GNAT family N-acetyltransferase n=1 Tax=Devosia sp. TaxID=1871048 RepID=UPI0024CD6A2D|nr:GNAT family N-acetyltransferase [Devosia sp.]UYN98470.1 MAG: GNAT family N-acetyltransferase [Devosia sp.]